MQVWDEDDEDQLMGKIPQVARDGHAHLELDEAHFKQLDIQGHGKLYAFKVGFLYECYIPGVSPQLPRSLISAQAYKRGPIRMKTLAKAAHQFGRAGAVTMHPLPFHPVRLMTASGSPDGSFDAYVYINDICGNRRAAERLAVVTIPPMEAARGPAACELETPAMRAATIPLHHRLVERGWNVLAYEANALSDDGCGEAELAKLRAAMAYCSQHKLLRYCRVSLVTQGTGASAALMAMHDYSHELSDRVRVISACEPAGDEGLLDAVLTRYAPQCTVPVLLLGQPAAATTHPEAWDDKLPPLPQVPMAQQVAKRLPTAVPSRVVMAHNYPLVGKARRIEGSRFFGDYPEKLIPFLHDHSCSLAVKSRMKMSMTSPQPSRQRISLQASQSLPQLARA